MTDQQWAIVEIQLTDFWPSHDWDDQKASSHRARLADLPFEELQHAIDSLSNEDRDWRPSVGTIRARALGHHAPPAFPVVCQQLGTHPALRQLPRPEYTAEKNEYLARQVARAALDIHPAAAAMLADVGLEALRRAPLDPRFPPAEGEEGIELRVRLARLRDGYAVRVERWNGGDRAELDIGEIANRLLPSPAHTGMRELVEALRPVSALPAGDDQQSSPEGGPSA